VRLVGAARFRALVVDVDDLRGREHEFHVAGTAQRGHHPLDAEGVQQIVVEQGFDQLAFGREQGGEYVVGALHRAALVDHAGKLAADRLDSVGRAVVADQDLYVRVGLADRGAQALLEVRRLVRRDHDAN
jgi:hypothetical protein